MRGIGRASSAITIVNAVPSGRGAAAAIRLGCQASVEMIRVGAGELPSLEVVGGDTPLARAAVRAALRAYAPMEEHHVRLRIDSEIPPARGFKSSSAVTVAIFEAVAHARGHSPDPEEVARRSAELGRALGASATGAFDDAMAAAAGGVVLTDNEHDVLLGRGPFVEGLDCLLLVPPAEHLPSPELAPRFADRREESLRAFAHATAGEYLEAIERNSRLVESVMGYRLARARTALVQIGARLVAVSGMGPGLFALVPSGAGPEIAASVDDESVGIHLVGFRPPGETARLSSGPAEER